MKRRILTCLLAVTMIILSVTAVSFPAGAATPTTGEIWSVYTLVENQNGIPVYGTPPTFAYGDDGLTISTAADDDYTVQSDYAYSLQDGFFVEIRMNDTETFIGKNQLVFHLWSQVGMIVGYDRSGSGYYGLISVAGDAHYLISMGVVEDGSEAGKSKLFGATKLQPKKAADGSFVYTMSVVDGVFYVNGKEINESGEIMQFLGQTCPKGVHVGATLMAGEDADHTSVTLTRFGRTQSTAAIPGTVKIPENPPAQETETTAPADPNQPDTPTTDLIETEKPQEQVTKDPEDTREPAEDEATDAAPPRDTDPSDPTPDGDGTDPAPDGEGEENKESITLDGDVAQNTLDFFNKINLFDGCSSTVSLVGGVALATLLCGAALSLKKKE